MRRFLLGVVTVLMTVVIVVAAAFLLAKMENREAASEETVQPSSTPTVMAEATQPAVTLAAETLPQQVTEPVKTKYDTVPRYYQTDYPYIKFGNGTVATSGCSVTCLAMVATYLTDHEYLPDELAYHFKNFGKTNIERLEYGNERLQLPCEKNENIQDVLKALKAGKVVIAMMDDESLFTTEQHFIVLAGMTEDGKFIVNDPMETNYTNADVYLKNAYDNGFADYDLMRGFSGAWIYDKNAMPEEPFLFDAEKPEQEENRYAGYELTGEDIYTLACFAWAEAREEPAEVQQAVVEVVLNRVVSEDYPNTVHDVIYQTELYRAVSAMAKVDEPELAQYQAVTAAMYGPYILPADVCFYSEWEAGTGVWGELGSFVFALSR